MSTRRERANRWWLRCPKCGEWKARHCIGAGRGFGGNLYSCQPASTDLTATTTEERTDETRN